MTERFTSHEEIDAMTASYILQVADAQSICDIPLEDINSFLEGLDDHIINGCIYWQDRLDEEDGQPSWEQEWQDFGECYE